VTNRKISEAALARARAETRLSILGEFSKLYERLSEEKGINQSRISK
jgi:hypothetical protein